MQKWIEMGQIVQEPGSTSLCKCIWGIKWHKQMFKSWTSRFFQKNPSDFLLHSPIFTLILWFQTMRSHRLVVDEIVRSSIVGGVFVLHALDVPNVYVWGCRFSHWSMELESTRRPSGTLSWFNHFDSKISALSSNSNYLINSWTKVRDVIQCHFDDV